MSNYSYLPITPTYLLTRGQDVGREGTPLHPPTPAPVDCNSHFLSESNPSWYNASQFLAHLLLRAPHTIHRCKALAYLLHVEPRVLSGSSRTSKNKTLLRIEQWIPKLPAMTCANPVGKQLMLNCFASVTCTWSPWWFSSMAAKTLANSVAGRLEGGQAATSAYGRQDRGGVCVWPQGGAVASAYGQAATPVATLGQ